MRRKSCCVQRQGDCFWRQGATCQKLRKQVRRPVSEFLRHRPRLGRDIVGTADIGHRREVVTACVKLEVIRDEAGDGLLEGRRWQPPAAGIDPTRDQAIGDVVAELTTVPPGVARRQPVAGLVTQLACEGGDLQRIWFILVGITRPWPRAGVVRRNWLEVGRVVV